jgi:hypothetical protein
MSPPAQPIQGNESHLMPGKPVLLFFETISSSIKNKPKTKGKGDN